jgi:putative transposase
VAPHKGGHLVVSDNIGLLKLPPYSPELNPVENIWEYLRQNYLSNRTFATYETIVDACCDAWNKLIGAPEGIRSPPMNMPKRSAHESGGIRAASSLSRLRLRRKVRNAMRIGLMRPSAIATSRQPQLGSLWILRRRDWRSFPVQRALLPFDTP